MLIIESGQLAGQRWLVDGDVVVMPEQTTGSSTDFTFPGGGPVGGGLG